MHENGLTVRPAVVRLCQRVNAVDEYVCLGCFRVFVGHLDSDDFLTGISWAAEAPAGTACVGCEAPLPESPDREAEARQVLTEARPLA